MAWSGKFCAFIAEECIKSDGSPIVTQRSFASTLHLINMTPFWIRKLLIRRFAILDKKVMPQKRRNLLAALSLQQDWKCGFSMERNAAVSTALSTKHIATLQLSGWCVQRLLCRYLKMCTYKVVMVRELINRDFETCMRFPPRHSSKDVWHRRNNSLFRQSQLLSFGCTQQ